MEYSIAPPKRGPFAAHSASLASSPPSPSLCSSGRGRRQRTPQLSRASTVFRWASTRTRSRTTIPTLYKLRLRRLQKSASSSAPGLRIHGGTFRMCPWGAPPRSITMALISRGRGVSRTKARLCTTQSPSQRPPLTSSSASAPPGALSPFPSARCWRGGGAVYAETTGACRGRSTSPWIRRKKKETPQQAFVATGVAVSAGGRGI